MVDIELFGLKPGGHHLVNLFFHVLNTLLLYTFLYRVTGASGRSLLVASLFAIHPLHVESVAWVSERKDVLSTLFFMSTLLAYHSYVNKPVVVRYLAVFVLLALGLMAKPMLVTLPFVLLLLDFWPLQRIGLQSLPRKAVFKLVIEKLPLFALIIASSVVTYLVQHEGGAINTLSQAPLAARLSNVLISYVIYIRDMIWPVNLAVIYPLPKSIPSWQPAGALLALLSISYVVVKFARRFAYLPVGWFWYLGTLVPVIGIIQVGTQAHADRYTYIPLIGLFIIIAWGGYDLLVRGSTKRAPAILLAVLVVLGLTTMAWLQVRHWSDAKTLWERALAVTNGNFRAHVAYGSLLAEEGYHQQAAEHFSAAVRIQPNYAEAHNKLGVELAELGRSEEAILHYREALKYRPDLGIANTNLGNALTAQGRTEEALRYYEKALQLDQDDPVALNSLGSALDDLGRVDDAITLYRKALKLNPRLSAAHNNLAAAYARKGQFEKAVGEMKVALNIDQGNATYHYNYAVLLSQQGETRKALDHLEYALSIDPGNSAARRALEIISEENKE